MVIPPAGKQWRPWRVLVIDHDPKPICRTISLLNGMGIVGKASLGGNEALRLLRQETFDLALIELDMPGFDGCETIRRAVAKILTIPPIVGCSDNVSPEMVKRAKKAGCLDLLAKPIEAPALHDLLIGLGWQPHPEAGGVFLEQGGRLSSPRQISLVTGAGGFIGGHLVSALRLKDELVRAVDRRPVFDWSQRVVGADNWIADLDDPVECRRLCVGVETVYHLADETGGRYYDRHHQVRGLLAALPTVNLLQAALEAGVKRFFFASCSSVYPVGTLSATGLDVEENAWPAKPESGAGLEKLFSENLCFSFQEEHGLPVRLARLHNVYGPHASWEGGREGPVAAVCRKMVAALHGGCHSIEVAGHPDRPFSVLYISEAVRGIIEITGGALAGPFNLASNEPVTLRQLVQAVSETSGLECVCSYVPNGPGEPSGRGSDNSRFRKAFGWEPSLRLREGIDWTFRWIFDQYCRHYGPMPSRYHPVSAPSAEPLTPAGQPPSSRSTTAPTVV